MHGSFLGTPVVSRPDLCAAKRPRSGAAPAVGTRRVTVAMGRRSEKIKGRKEKQDRVKVKTYSRIGKLITAAVKSGGPDAETNKALADALELAKDASVPKDNVERAISRASGKDQADYKESTFEVYGHGGVRNPDMPGAPDRWQRELQALSLQQLMTHPRHVADSVHASKYIRGRRLASSSTSSLTTTTAQQRRSER